MTHRRKSVFGQIHPCRATLTPALSRASGRGRIIGSQLEIPATALAGRTTQNQSRAIAVPSPRGRRLG